MYSNPLKRAAEEIAAEIRSAAERACAEGALKTAELAPFEVAPPSEKNRGDLFTNFAMQNAKTMGMAPRKIAEEITARMNCGALVEKIEIAGPGFVNIHLSPAWYAEAVAAVRSEGADFGRTDGGAGRKVMVEFVSANPTGPMHMGNARGGVIGDVVASLLTHTGCDVTREFYINDAGNQVDLFARSLEARLIQAVRGEDAVVFPEEGYHGDDIRALAAAYLEEHGDAILGASEEARRAALAEFGLARNIAAMKRDMERYRIQFDVWFPESDLHKSGAVEETVQLMVERGCTYEKEGALWFKATDFGCEKDEVLRRQNGFYTYYAVDLAYHRNKFMVRGFDKVIDVFGADHHGHTIRFKAGMDAIGVGADKLDFVLMQLVNLMRGGEVVRMSKRTGKAVSLSDLLDEIPVDAARFFFSSRTPSTTMDFDLDLAVKQESDNPVYYVQYAHARICSILRSLAEAGVKADTEADLTLLSDPAERELTMQLALLPEEIKAAADAYDPARMVRYLTDTATLFHKFYNACRVSCDDPALRAARTQLVLATKQVLENVCAILKVTAPERM